MATLDVDTLGHWGFDVVIAREGDGLVVRVRGELDVATASVLGDLLHDVIDNQGVLTIAIDLAGVDFIDSTGLGVLVGARRNVVDRGGHLALVAPTAATTRALEVTGMAQLFEIRSLA